MQEVLSVPDVVAALKPGYCHARNAAARAAGAAGPSFCTQYAGTPHEGLGHFAMPGADFSELFETAAVGVEDLTAAHYSGPVWARLHRQWPADAERVVVPNEEDSTKPE